MSSKKSIYYFVSVLFLLMSCGGKEIEPFSGPEFEEPNLLLMVSGMVCNDCPREVRDAILTVDGVTEARVDFADSTAKILYDTKLAKPEQIMEAIKNGGSHSNFSATIQKQY